ncbi:site-2 protease family protein [Pseudodesulfovibrio sp. zrk46]|uniref:site-2 protease family protein n=1 Tax=Pseudodesulfovibrio sp. zrk46 TaxID=2725288 RepID=UPI001448D3DC|nr:site-2 protease family protein [Pseudodesulfovibrio sp. zrk46]QJB55084.1 site-2 protease family protein [Pseudodesulfovibrio sp. zrk46]
MFDFFSPEALQRYAILAPGLLLALVCHEVGHGFVAYLLGDPTAKSEGRLTLNPIKHLDLFGTLAFFIVQFGWAKPVPVNPRYFRNPRLGMLLTAIAGPGVNFILAAIFAVAIHIMTSIPFTPGSTTENVIVPLYLICQAGVFVNLILGVFNLIPIPPLDGSNVLAYFLPPQMAYKYMSLSRYGFLILIGLIIVGRYSGYNLVGGVILPMVRGAAHLLGINI